MRAKKVKAKCRKVSEESKRIAYQESVEKNIYILMMRIFWLFPEENTDLKQYGPDARYQNTTRCRHIYPILAKAFGIPRHLRGDFDYCCKTPAEMAKFVAFKVWDLKKSKAKYLHTEHGYAVRS